MAGPVVALTNEHAGSDGDIFSHAFKLMGIGPLVGTRTWGGVIGIWPRHKLVDGTETTQPEFSFWFNDVGWGVENYGTDPQIEVDNAPQDAMSEKDRQLETALETALELVERSKGKPEFGARPNLAHPAWRHDDRAREMRSCPARRVPMHVAPPLTCLDCRSGRSIRGSTSAAAIPSARFRRGACHSLTASMGT